MCKVHVTTPRIFKIPIGSEELRFKHWVVVDTMFLNARPVLHVINEATHFTAATFLRDQSANEIFKQIYKLWALSYMAPPDFLTVDQAPTELARQRTTEEAKEAVLQEHRKRKIEFALRHQSSPKAKERSRIMHDLPAGSPVFVYRKKSKRWEGPFKYINIDG